MLKKQESFQMSVLDQTSFSRRVEELTEKIRNKDSDSGSAAIELANLLNNGGLHHVCVWMLFQN